MLWHCVYLTKYYKPTLWVYRIIRLL
jgi:hypothetical protein